MFIPFVFLIPLQDVHITDNPVLLLYQLGNPSGLKAQFYVHENLTDTTYEVVNETDLWMQFIHLRLQARLPLICELQADAIREALLLLQKKVGICSPNYKIVIAKRILSCCVHRTCNSNLMNICYCLTQKWLI
jgi:hypothetical protein